MTTSRRDRNKLIAALTDVVVHTVFTFAPATPTERRRNAINNMARCLARAHVECVTHRVQRRRMLNTAVFRDWLIPDSNDPLERVNVMRFLSHVNRVMEAFCPVTSRVRVDQSAEPRPVA